MVVQGHIQNGLVVPHGNISAPNGTEVTITVHDSRPAADTMSDEEQMQYLATLATIDSAANENPGDSFRGADHDRALYGDGS
jgi:hypothetical protein